MVLIQNSLAASVFAARWQNPFKQNGSTFILPLQKESSVTLQTLFETAAENSGQVYLEAEQKLRNAESEALPMLRANLQNQDPIIRLFASVLVNWIEGRSPDNQAALDYLEYIPKRAAETPLGVPPPDGVAAELTYRFGARVVDLAAVRLVKETNGPQWRTESFLLYLAEHKSPSATAALIRFAADTQNTKWQDIAVETIKQTDDRDMRLKIASERQRLQKLNRVLPKVLADLESP